MTKFNPISDLLGIAPAADKHTLLINGVEFELYPDSWGNAETMYRANPGYGVGNPGFAIAPWQKDGKTALGLYLTDPRKRSGMKRAQSDSIVDAARDELANHLRDQKRSES